MDCNDEDELAADCLIVLADPKGPSIRLPENIGKSTMDSTPETFSQRSYGAHFSTHFAF